MDLYFLRAPSVSDHLRSALNNKTVFENFRSEISDFLDLFEKGLIEKQTRLAHSFQKENESIEEELQKEVKEYSKRVQKIVEEGEPENMAHQFANYPGHLDYAMDLNDELHSTITDLDNKSNLLMLYGFLESKLTELCNLTGQTIESKIKVKDISERDYLRKPKNYLQLVLEIDLQENNLNQFWADVKPYQSLRNKIAHENSNVEMIENKLTPIINDIKIKDGYVTIDKNDLILKFHKKIKCFFNDLFFLIEKRLDFFSINQRVNLIVKHVFPQAVNTSTESSYIDDVIGLKKKLYLKENPSEKEIILHVLIEKNTEEENELVTNNFNTTFKPLENCFEEYQNPIIFYSKNLLESFIKVSVNFSLPVG